LKEAKDFFEHWKWWLQQKCLILSLALHTAKAKMPFCTWDNCCKDAIDEGNHFCMNVTSSPCTVQNWYAEFREKPTL